LPTLRSVTDVARHFSDVINRVVFRGERFVLVRGNRPVAELRPVHPGVTLAELPARFAVAPRLAERDAGAFEADIAQARAALATIPLHDPWP
jgi:antitoxin (DNA-binding transcriptional repressor) of toxin-antitoxin stability system